MAFTVTGIDGGEPIEIIWDAGKVTTDHMTESWLRIYAKHHDDLGVPEMFLDPKDWPNGLAFLFLAKEVLDETTSVTGDVPVMPVCLTGDINDEPLRTYIANGLDV